MASAESIESLVTCPVCFETYQDPQILNCQHVLCAKCVRSVMKNSQNVPCPECRTISHLTDVKKDLNKQMLLDALQKQHEVNDTDEMTSDEEAENKNPSDGNVYLKVSCEICENDEMTWFCQLCDKFMCNQCEKAHSSFPALKDHKSEFIKDTVEDNNSKLKKILDEFELARKRAEHMLINSKQCRVNFENLQEENIVLINKQREGLKQAIDVFHDQLISDVKSSSGEITDQLETSKSSLLNIVERCSAKMKTVNQYVNNNNIRLLIQSGKTYSKDLSDGLQEIHTLIEQNQTISSVNNISIQYLKDINFSEFTSVVIEKAKLDLGEGYMLTKPPSAKESTSDLKVEVPSILATPIAEESTRNSIGNGVQKAIKRGRSRNARARKNATETRTRIFDGLHQKGISFVKIQEVDLGYWPKRINMADDKLWCTSELGVHIYDKNCENAKFIKLESVTNATAVVRSHIGSIVVACEKDGGLAEFDMNGKKKTVLSKGSFGDVMPFRGKLFALEVKKKKVYVFEQQNELWCLVTRFDCGSCSNNFDTIGVSKDSVFVCNWSSQSTRKYDYNGSYLKNYKTDSNTKLCDVDDNGAVLLAYFLDHSFYVLKEDGNQVKLNVKGEINGTSDAVISEDCKFIWAITRSYGTHNLIKLAKSSL